VSNLLNELALRLLKVGIAVLLGLILYVVLTGPVGQPGSVELALLCWLSAAAFILLIESGMF
jgi:small-conductance mechanosensitive channel